MRVLITAVGQRTEHWTDFFAVLAARPGLEVTVAVADVSPLTERVMNNHAALVPGLRFRRLPHTLGEAHSGHMASILLAPNALGAMKIERPDIIHVIGEAAYLSTAQVISHRNRRWPHVPITHYAAQNVVTRFPAPFPWLERRAYRAVGHMLPITPAALDVLRRKGYQGDATIVPLGVDQKIFTPSMDRAAGRPFTVGFVGRLETHKGIRDLLQATEIVDADLLVVGRGTEAALVGDAVRRRPGRVNLQSWVDHGDLPALLARMDVLVLPSWEIVQRNVLPWIGIPLREQFGRVLVEAMACGIPVVGSDVGEIPHVVGSAGLIFPAGDVRALADRLGRLRDDPALARRLGLDGLRRTASEFSWNQVAATTEQIWRSPSLSHRDDRQRRRLPRLSPSARTMKEMVTEQ